MEVELGVTEGIEAEDADASIGLAEVPPAQDAQEGTLASPVRACADEEKYFAG